MPQDGEKVEQDKCPEVAPRRRRREFLGVKTHGFRKNFRVFLHWHSRELQGNPVKSWTDRLTLWDTLWLTQANLDGP